VLSLLSRSPSDRPPHAFAVYDALVALLGEPPSPLALPLPPTSEVPHVVVQRLARESSNTMVDDGLPAEVSALHAHETSDLAARAAIGTVEWHQALARLEAAIAGAQRGEGRATSSERLERAVELATLARVKVRSLERVSLLVASQQAKVDALEEEGRVFRADIGRALDQLVLDRARAQTRAAEMSERLATMTGGPRDDRTSDAFLWETTALRVATGTSEVDLDDLTFQIDALERRLHEQNAALEEQIVEASGALEGSLAAVRHLTHELARLLTDATAEVRAPGQTGAPPQAGDPLWGLARGWREGRSRR
jgi:hypothetical protein